MSKELKPEDFENELEYVEAELGINILEQNYKLNEEGKLIELDISNNIIVNLKIISKLTHLRELYLINNHIDDLNELSSLTSLTILYLSDNKIVDIYPLSNLTSLIELNLSDNRINNLKALTKLISLTKLYLSFNQISNISVLTNLTLLRELDLYNNPINNVPKIILKSSAQEIIRWLKENKKKGDKVLLNDIKILLLGNTNIGKSNLLFFWDQLYVKREIYDEYPEDSNSTHGLVYKELQKDRKSPLLHIWDFGGQEYFHATHQLFFSPEALHVLLWSKGKLETREKEEEIFELDYWLRCSEQLSKDESPIEMVLIENRIDFTDENNNTEFYSHFPEQQYIGKFNMYSPHKKTYTNKPPFMINTCSTSLKYQKRLQGMFELLEERIQILHQKNLHPPKYAEIRDVLATSKRKYWTLTQYKKRFEEEDNIILKTLHKLGCLLYFDKQLPNKIFTQPELLLELIYEKILNEDLKENQGKLTNELVEAAKNNNFGLVEQNIQSLLSAFKLIFKTQDDCWYAPQYLPKISPAWLQLLKDYTFGVANIIVSSDHYLMNSILLDIFSEYAGVIKKDDSYLFWQKGLVIEKDGQLLLIEYDRKQMRLLLYGDQQEKNQQLQREVVDFVLKTVNKSNKKTLNDGSRSHDIIWKDGKMYPSKNIEDNRFNWNNETLDVLVSIDGNYYVNVHTLHENVQNKIYTIKAFHYDDDTSFKAFSVFQFNQYLADKDKGIMKKVAISYSKDDLKLVNEFIKNLVPLQDDGLIASPVWYCTDLEAGSEWDKTIQENFEAADIIFFMVSPNFLANNYIKEYEVKTAIRKFNQQKEKNVPIAKRLRIIPIRLEYCSWIRKDASINLGRFSALPYKAKPVTDYHNRNEAWYLVTENIRMVIENETELNSFKTSKEISDLQERQVEGK